MKNTLFISDLDGTLLKNDKTLSSYSIKTLNDLIDMGLNFTYATARSYYSAYKIIKPLNLTLPVLHYNGTIISSPSDGSPLYTHKFSTEDINIIKDIFCRYSLYPLVYSVIGGYEKVLWQVSKETSGVKAYLNDRKDDPRLEPVTNRDDIYQGEIFYFTCIGEKGELIKAHKALTEISSINSILIKDLYRDEYWLELVPAGASKGASAGLMKNNYGFTRLVVFGDAMNYFSAFKSADLSYAVSNADDNLKAVASGVIGSNESDAVAKFLWEYMKKNENSD